MDAKEGLLKKIEQANERHSEIGGNFGREMTITMSEAFLVRRLISETKNISAQLKEARDRIENWLYKLNIGDDIVEVRGDMSDWLENNKD